MYRLLLYYLVGLLSVATILGFLKLLPYDPIAILFSASFIVLVCALVNTIFARVYKAPVNAESFYLTALILALVISPPSQLLDWQYLSLAVCASTLSMASKFILARKKKHIFNPVAIAIAITAFTIGQSVSWWVGTLYMAPFVLVGGILITRKIQRFDLVLSFLAVAFGVVIAGHFAGLSTIFTTLYRSAVYTPVLFFAFVMLTEPLTTPPKRLFRLLYGALVGFLFTPVAHIGTLYFTPELALVVGNIFSYLASPKQKLVLILKEKRKVANGVYDFIFSKKEPFVFKPGQYLEWTVSPKNADNRGNRRYFTIASSPADKNITMGVKFYPESSTFKQQLLSMPVGSEIVASQLAGEFVLPKNRDTKLVFIAGGIGVTPFRSMIKHLIDAGEKRDIVLLYSNKTKSDIAYKDIFDLAKEKIGLKVIYAITDEKLLLDNPTYLQGFINKDFIVKQIPDYAKRKFYVSGPPGMVDAFNATLSSLGIRRSHIKTDFFPGFV